MDLVRLQAIFESVMKRQEDKVDPIRAGFGRIEKEEVDMEQKTKYIDDYIQAHKHMSFRDLLEKQHSKAEVIVTFLVILEMMKVGKIDIRQEHTFDDIEITRREDITDGK
jgi:segregation and condensation protein A